MTFGFTNIHIFLGAQPAPESRTTIIAAINELLLHRNFLSVADPRQADRIVAIGPSGLDAWLSICDDAIGGDASLDQLLHMIRTLSSHLHAHVVGFKLVERVLHMLLAFDGRLLDHVVIKSRYRAPTKPKESAYLREHAQRWQVILPAGMEPQHLQTVWQHTQLDRVEGYTELAHVLGMSAEWTVCDWTDLERELHHRPEARETSWAAGVTTLNYRLRTPPSYRRSTSQPPKLIPSSANPLQLSIPTTPDLALLFGNGSIRTQFRSIGKATRGIRIVLGGSAIEQRLIEPRSIRLSVLRQTEEPWPEQDATWVPLMTNDVAEELTYQAIATDFDIPAGLEVLETDERYKYGLPLYRIYHAYQCTQIGILIEVDVAQPGTGELTITAILLETQDTGLVSRKRAIIAQL